MIDNQQAYPCLDSSGGGLSMRDPGMTLRDYFAGHVLTALIAAAAKHPQPLSVADKVANDSYRIADAMLAERSKP